MPPSAFLTILPPHLNLLTVPVAFALRPFTAALGKSAVLPDSLDLMYGSL